MYHVSIRYEDELQVYIAESSDTPGLVLECGSLDALIERIRFASSEIILLNNLEESNSIEISCKFIKKVHKF